MRYQLRLATSPRHRRRQALAIGLTVGTLLAFGIDAWQGPILQSRFWIIFLSSGLIAGMLFHRFLTRRGGFVGVWLDLDRVSLRMITARGQQLWEIPFQGLRVDRPAPEPRQNLLIQGAGVRFQLQAAQLVALDGQAIDDPVQALTLLEHQLITRHQQSAAAAGLPPSTTWSHAEGPGDRAPGGGVTLTPQVVATSSLGPATLTISAILGLVFLLQWRLGAVFGSETFNPMMLLAMGANSSPLVQGGEWQRLITGNFLHGDLRHLLFNGFALVSFGRIIEARLGAARFLFIFLSACLGGAVASALFNDALISIGSSTGILGLVGAYGVIDWFFASDRRSALRRQAIMLFLALGLPALLIPNADHFGHVGGLLVGLLVTAWVLSPFDALPASLLAAAEHSPELRQAIEAWLPHGDLPDDAQRRRHLQRLRLAKVMAATLSLLFLGVATWTGLHFQPQGSRHEALALLAFPDLPPFFANNAAWIVAIDQQATRDELQRARQGMAWAEALVDTPLDGSRTDNEPLSANLDTLATLHFRLGDLDRAIQIQRRALAMAPDSVLASQLSRFEATRLERQGPYLDGFQSAPQIRLQHPRELACPADDANSEGAYPTDLSAVMLNWTDSGITRPVASETPGTSEAPETAPEVHILLERGGAPVALLQAHLGPPTSSKMICDLPAELLTCDVEAKVSLAAASSMGPFPAADTGQPGPTVEAPAEDPPEISASAALGCQVFRLDEEVLALPGPV